MQNPGQDPLGEPIEAGCLHESKKKSNICIGGQKGRTVEDFETSIRRSAVHRKEVRHEEKRERHRTHIIRAQVMPKNVQPEKREES